MAMSDEEIFALYEAVARDRTMESMIALASALAEKVLAEKDFVQQREHIQRQFAEQQKAIRRSQGEIPLEATRYREDKLFELRQFLLFLRHSYAAAAAVLKATQEVRSLSHAVGRIHSFRLEQAARELGEHGKIFAGVRETLDAAASATLSLHRRAGAKSLSLSRVAYRKVKCRLRRVRLRSFGRWVRRHAFLVIVGFLGASYLLGGMPDAIGNATGTAFIGFALALALWTLDRSVISPWIDRRFEKFRKADGESDLADLKDAFLWAHISRVFSAAVLHEVLESTNAEYRNAVEKLSDPDFRPGGRGLTG